MSPEPQGLPFTWSPTALEWAIVEWLMVGGVGQEQYTVTFPSVRPPYMIFVLSSDPVPEFVDPELKTMPAQSPPAGALAAPSPLVSPPTESSLSEVKVIGLAWVPMAWTFPLTLSAPPAGSPLRINPGPKVRVAPESTVTWPAKRTIG